MSALRVSIQLYTVREATANDFIGTCEKLADMGYEWVELAGLGGYSPEALNQHLRGLGLRISGSHISPDALKEPARFIDECKALSVKEATIPWLPEKLRNSGEGWRDVGKQLEETCLAFKRAGIRLGYHNHHFEFAMFDGKQGFDLLFENAPSSDLQLDMYWAAKAGNESVAILDRFRGRVPSVHFKDLGTDGEDIEFGQGVLNWCEIFAACKRAGTETLVLEMDKQRHEPLESARQCLEGINRLLEQESQT